MGYEQDLRIDESNLHEEWMLQPTLFAKYAATAADSSAARDRAKEHVDLVRAEIDMAIRANPEEFGLGAKVTENAITGAILQDSEYQKASEEFIKAKHEYDMIRVAVNAFEQRKVALENLVKLIGMGYWGSPQVKNLDNKQQAESIEEYTNNAVREVRTERINRRLNREK